MIEAATGRKVRQVMHVMRHTAATQMVQAGIDLSTVQEVLGHSTIKLTERHRYFQQDHKREQLTNLDYGMSATPGRLVTGPCYNTVDNDQAGSDKTAKSFVERA
jgi:hypothetical protein